MRNISFGRLTVLVTALALLTIGTSLFADSGPNHQVRNQHFGVSGGNVNDISTRFCCSGTLGSLVTDGGTQYVLSNNHVLADSGTGRVGDSISQPGLVDVGCNAANAATVANLTAWPRLGSNVDAALAQIISGTMDSTGFIEDIGTISSVVKAPAVALAVEKSGRTTGLTTGSISSINTSVSVKYTTTCGGRKGFIVTYTGQVVVTPGSFSAGGDSGSLIVSNNAACPQPVALLFAGSSTSTIGNPIGEVLAKVGSAFTPAKSISFVGGQCTASVPEQPISEQTPAPSIESVERATNVMRTREADLMSRPGILGIGVGASDTNPTDAAIVVYVDVNAGSASVPRRINGVRVRKVFTEPFVAY